MKRTDIGLVVALVLLSIVLGSVFGAVAGLSMGLWVVWPVAAAFGGAVGLLWSPAFVWALVPGRVAFGVVCIFVPTCIAALVSGVMSSSNGNPFVSMAVACATYVIASMLFGAWSRAHPLPERYRDGCTKCGYSLRGNVTGVCPECGTAVSVASAGEVSSALNHATRVGDQGASEVRP